MNTKKATKSTAHHCGKYCLCRSMSAWAQTQPACSASSTEPPSDRNTSRLGMGWIEDLLSQEWILSRQQEATFWPSKLSQMLQDNPFDPLSPGQSGVLGSGWLSPHTSDADHAAPTSRTQGSSDAFTQSLIPPENPALMTAAQEQDT